MKIPLHIIAVMLALPCISCGKADRSSDSPDAGVKCMPEEIPANDADFDIVIYEKRYSKTITWRSDENGGLIPDYDLAGRLTVTDWNSIQVCVMSSDSCFNGVNVSAGNDALKVRRDDGVLHGCSFLTISRNKAYSGADASGSATTALTFTAGRHSRSIELKSREFIDLKGVWFRWSTVDGSPSDCEEEILLIPEQGMITASYTGRANHLFYYESDMNHGTEKEMVLTFIRPEPLNTSWRILDFRSGFYDRMYDEISMKHPEYEWVKTAEKVDFDYLCGKSFHYSGVLELMFVFHPFSDMASHDDGKPRSLLVSRSMRAHY